MNTGSKTVRAILTALPRMALILLLMAVPVLGVSAVRADNGATIEAPTLKKSGAGLVLLVSLQRG